MKYFQEKYETMNREDLSRLQDKLFVRELEHAYNNNKYYRKKMNEANIKIEDICGIKDCYKLPLMTKEDLRITYPDALLAVPKIDCVRIQSTSGTTGKRVVAYYTRRDIEIWEECCARAIISAGGNEEDVCQVSYGYGLFTGGAGLNGGAQKVGCLTIPMSTGNTHRQIELMMDLNSTILCCTPSYATALSEYVLKNNFREHIKLKIGIFGAEPWTNELRNKIEKELCINAYDIYGLTEIMGPGVAFECSEKNGLHIQEDHFYPEVINPITQEVLEEGEVGELVITCLTKEALPLIRYRTGDLCKLFKDECPCGRTHIKMSKIIGRCDDMLIVKGVNVWPSQIESVLIKLGYSSNFMICVERVHNSDVLDVYIENIKEIKELRLIEEQLYVEKKIKEIIDIKLNVHIKEVGTIKRQDGKGKRVEDRRTLYK